MQEEQGVPLCEAKFKLFWKFSYKKIDSLSTTMCKSELIFLICYYIFFEMNWILINKINLACNWWIHQKLSKSCQLLFYAIHHINYNKIYLHIRTNMRQLKKLEKSSNSWLRPCLPPWCVMCSVYRYTLYIHITQCTFLVRCEGLTQLNNSVRFTVVTIIFFEIFVLSHFISKIYFKIK